MTQLADVRNTTELKTGAQKYLRQIEIADDTVIFVGAIGAINAAGKAVPASDTAGLIVLGRVEDVDTDNNVAEICSGVYLYENGEDAEALAITDLNKVVYVVDDQTVGKVGGSNKIVAGILRDVLTDGTVAVEVGNIAGDGVDGVDGDDGVDGTSSYTYVAYASDDQATDFATTPTDLLKYRAEIHVSTPIAEPAVGDFATAVWVKYLA